MTGELLNLRAGIKLGYVPTLGAAKVVQDIMSGNLSVVVDSLPGMAGALQTGAVKALATAADSGLPTTPTCRWSPKPCPASRPRAGSC